MRKLDHCNIVRLRYFFYSSGEKVTPRRRGGDGDSGGTGQKGAAPPPHPPCAPPSPQKDEVYLNLVLDFVPETVYRVARHFSKAKQTIPVFYVKVNPPAPGPPPRP